jgi:nicotinamide-nucleotide amidase
VSTSEDQTDTPGDDNDRVERLAELARAGDRTIGIAESLTSGRISTRLGAGPEASEWFRGAVVAYDKEVKFEVLGVTEGPVVTDSCARQMAVGVRRLLGADIGLGISGVGGPGPEEGRPAGTVHLAVASIRGVRSLEVHVPGAPREVLDTVTSLALDELVRELEAS